MDRKGQIPGCDLLTDPCVLDPCALVSDILGPFIDILKNIPLIGDCVGSFVAPFDLKVPLGPLSVITVVIGALVTSAINFFLPSVALAMVGVALVGSLVYKLR